MLLIPADCHGLPTPWQLKTPAPQDRSLILHRFSAEPLVSALLPVQMRVHRNVHRGNASRRASVAVQTGRMSRDTDARGWPPIDPDDGWAGILTTLRDDLLRIDPGHTVHQVKQKFGELSVSADASDPALADAVHDRIAAALRPNSVEL
ncbi:hypothetical protein ABQF35_30570 [Mycobacterium syngnathidarum]